MIDDVDIKISHADKRIKVRLPLGWSISIKDDNEREVQDESARLEPEYSLIFDWANSDRVTRTTTFEVHRDALEPSGFKRYDRGVQMPIAECLKYIGFVKGDRLAGGWTYKRELPDASV